MRGLGATAGGLIGTLLPDKPAAKSAASRTLAQLVFTRRAMGCEFSVHLPPGIDRSMEAAHAALDEIEALEELLTVYAADSRMAYVNAHAADRPVHVDDRLFQLLEMCSRLHRQTEGAFDPATGALIRAWGFLRGPRRVPAEDEIVQALGCCGMEHVELDVTRRTVHYRKPGLEINFGSIGKGYAIDRAVARVKREFGVDCVLMQGGTSSMVAAGSPAGDGDGWLVGIQNPFDPRKLVAEVRLRDRALGTSGAANQFFVHRGHRYGHVLDPRTGRPAEGLASATAIAASGALADALATAFFVMGLDKTRAFCHNHPDVAALLVLLPGDPCRTPATPAVVTFNLPGRDVNLRPSEDVAGDQTSPGDPAGLPAC